MEYSTALKIIREKLFLTQKELAELLDVSFETVNRWENENLILQWKWRRESMKSAKIIILIWRSFNMSEFQIKVEEFLIKSKKYLASYFYMNNRHGVQLCNVSKLEC